MSLFDWLFGRNVSAAATFDLPALVARLSVLAPSIQGSTADPQLIRARLADAYRDFGAEPMLPERFDDSAHGMDSEAWQRLRLVVAALDDDMVQKSLRPLVLADRVEAQVREGFIGFARCANLLTLELLRQSPLRLEELARRWLSALGAGVTGETLQESAERLRRLDYGRLLVEAEQAKRAAETKMKALKKLQDEEEAKRNRSKW